MGNFSSLSKNRAEMLNSRARVWEAEKTAKNSRSVNKALCARVGQGISRKAIPSRLFLSTLASPLSWRENQGCFNLGILASTGKALSHQTSMLPPSLTWLLFCCDSWRLLSTAAPPPCWKELCLPQEEVHRWLRSASRPQPGGLFPNLSLQVQEESDYGSLGFGLDSTTRDMCQLGPHPQPWPPLKQTHPAKTEVPLLLWAWLCPYPGVTAGSCPP